jgi:hypothetical protein
MTALFFSFPSPLVGEGRVGGREVTLSEDSCKKSLTPVRSSALARNLPTPTPNLSPQGGGEL